MMKRILIILTILIANTVAFNAQSITQERTSEELEKEVRQQTEQLASELGLTDKQAKEFERNTIKYSLKIDEVLQKDIPKKNKTFQINVLEEQRIRATRNILTKPQYDLYLKMLSIKDDNK
ncbi:MULTISPECIES: hypothetical protein [Croceibacter]|uniref:hypothetical protein n=1 Tax=Croceibacter TaxID=216431 RepID=UPI00235254CF|nr:MULTISPECIES: hypothetical protein [Croceibacter]|tara:strand:- start:7126 stop:7488 length:363 start_codon:yes stop_codon:yes gene_type:complete